MNINDIMPTKENLVKLLNDDFEDEKREEAKLRSEDMKQELYAMRHEQDERLLDEVKYQ